MRRWGRSCQSRLRVWRDTKPAVAAGCRLGYVEPIAPMRAGVLHTTLSARGRTRRSGRWGRRRISLRPRWRWWPVGARVRPRLGWDVDARGRTRAGRRSRRPYLSAGRRCWRRSSWRRIYRPVGRRYWTDSTGRYARQPRPHRRFSRLCKRQSRNRDASRSKQECAKEYSSFHDLLPNGPVKISARVEKKYANTASIRRMDRGAVGKVTVCRWIRAFKHAKTSQGLRALS